MVYSSLRAKWGGSLRGLVCETEALPSRPVISLVSISLTTYGQGKKISTSESSQSLVRFGHLRTFALNCYGLGKYLALVADTSTLGVKTCCSVFSSISLNHSDRYNFITYHYSSTARRGHVRVRLPGTKSCITLSWLFIFVLSDSYDFIISSTLIFGAIIPELAKLVRRFVTILSRTS